MLISHCHVFAEGKGNPGGEVDTGTNPAAGTLPELRHIMQEVGVDKAVAFAPFGPQTDAQIEGNEWLLAQLPDYAELIGFASVDPKREDAGEKLRELIGRGMRGAKYHPPVMQTAIDDPAAAGFWTAASEMKLSVHVHTGAHGWYLRRYQPLLLDDICRTYPDVRVIMDHMGCIPFFNEALAVLHNNQNAYCGLTQMSGRSAPYAVLEENRHILLQTVSPDRIIYGLDYPWNPHNLTALRQDIQWVGTWGLSDDDVAKIFGGNMERLISEVEPPA